MQIDFGTVAGISLATGIIDQAILNLWPGITPALRDRIGPFVALLTAVVLAVGFTVSKGGDFWIGLATGIAGAAGAAWGHDALNAAGAPV